MALTYVKIADNVLTTNTASITFSSISGTYTDLVLRYSVRMSPNQAQDTFDITTNITGSLYSTIRLQGSGSAATSSIAQTGATFLTSGFANCATSTSNTFTSGELYIPQYTVSANKPISHEIYMENNAATSYITAQAHLIRSTTTISSITCTASGNFVSGSSFFLYGIKKD